MANARYLSIWILCLLVLLVGGVSAQTINPSQIRPDGDTSHVLKSGTTTHWGPQRSGGGTGSSDTSKYLKGTGATVYATTRGDTFKVVTPADTGRASLTRTALSGYWAKAFQTVDIPVGAGSDSTLGKCLVFDAAGSKYVDCGNSSDFNFDGSFSVECWYKRISAGASFGGWMGGSKQTWSSGDWEFGWYSGTLYCGSYLHGFMNTYAIPNNTDWHHAVMTCDLTKWRFYEDGTKVDSANYSGSITMLTPGMWIGKRSDAFLGFNGSIDEFAFYKGVCLTQDTITAHYRSGKGTYLARGAGAKGLYHFDEGTGTACADSSGNGNNGTAYGSPGWDDGKVYDVWTIKAGSKFATKVWSLESTAGAFSSIDVFGDSLGKVYIKAKEIHFQTKDANRISIDSTGLTTAGPFDSLWIQKNDTNSVRINTYAQDSARMYHKFWQSGLGVAYACSLGGADTVDLGSSDDFHPTDSMSVELWLKRNTSGALQGIVTSMTNGTYSGWGMYINGNYLIFRPQYGEDVGTHTLSAEVWHHLVGTFKYPGKGYLYVDGSKLDSTVATAPINYSSQSPEVIIGDLIKGNGNFLFGVVDEFRFYNYPLPPESVTAHYSAGVGQYGWGTVAHLMCGLHFDEGTGVTAHDYGPNAHNGTLSAGAAWRVGFVPNYGGPGQIKAYDVWKSDLSGQVYGDAGKATTIRGSSISFTVMPVFPYVLFDTTVTTFPSPGHEGMFLYKNNGSNDTLYAFVDGFWRSVYPAMVFETKVTYNATVSSGDTMDWWKFPGTTSDSFEVYQIDEFNKTISGPTVDNDTIVLKGSDSLKVALNTASTTQWTGSLKLAGNTDTQWRIRNCTSVAPADVTITIWYRYRKNGKR